jgi:hypothetical protein
VRGTSSGDGFSTRYLGTSLSILSISMLSSEHNALLMGSLLPFGLFM